MSSGNAFKKDDEEDDQVSFFGYVSQKFHEKFIANIPSESILELPPKFVIPVGTIAYLASLLCFAYFANTSYNIERKQQFISLSEDDGECEKIPLAITADYAASSDGYWEGSQGYHPQYGKYTLELSEYINDEAGYQSDMMNTVLPELMSLSAASVDYDAMANLLLWMTWNAPLGSVEAGSQAKDRMVLNGDPRYIFQKSHMTGQLANEKGECDGESVASFDKATGQVNFHLSTEEFYVNSFCNTTATLDYMGYDENADHGHYNADIDIETIVVAAAVNRDIISSNDLVVVNGTVEIIPVSADTSVEISQRYHPNFPGLPRRFCVITLGDTIAYPVLNHIGNGEEEPAPCNCDNDADRAITSHCQEHDFLYGLVFYNLPSTEEAIKTGQNPQFSNNNAIAQLVLKVGLGNIDELAYNASFAASKPGQFTDPAWRRNAYDFCQLPGFGGCSLLMFHSYETGAYYVNKYFYEVRSPACADTFSVSYTAWLSLANNPPTSLTETYFACTATVFDAIFNSIGISIGNVQFFVPLFMLLVMPLVYFYLLTINHVPPKPEYEKEEYEAALNAFAKVMLRLRDGKSRNLVKNGVLDNLVKELKKAATVQGGYPDSDDDSDDEIDSDDEESDDGSEEILDDPNKKFGLHNVFRRASADSVKRKSSVGGGEGDGTAGKKTRSNILNRLTSRTSKSSLINEPKSDSKDVEMGKRPSKRNSSFLNKQEKEVRRMSNHMKKLSIIIVNASVDNNGKKNKRRKALNQATLEAEGKAFRNKEKIVSLITEAYEAMEKAKRVKDMDGFLGVFRVASKKCTVLAQVDLDFVPADSFPTLLSLVISHTCLLLQCEEEDLVGPILDTYAYQFFMRHQSIRELRILSHDASVENNCSTNKVSFT